MAVIKHISVKGSNGGDALNYVLYKHNEKTGELLEDGRGNPVMRDEYYLDGINCEPYSFAAECKEINDLYGKNQLPGDIKAHHFIVSYDPKDGVDHGLTGPKAQQLSMEWAERCLPGFQILVCTHMDGSNESGNIHTHIMMNSVRKCDTKLEMYGERDIDHKAGYKLHLTDDYLRYMKQELMNICEREGLHQIDLTSPAKDRITDKEYRAQQKGQHHLEKQHVIDGGKLEKSVFQTQKQFLRESVMDVASRATSFDSFCMIMKQEYNVLVKEHRGRISYLHPDREKYITGRALGISYEKESVMQMLMAGREEKESFRSIEGNTVSFATETIEDCINVFKMNTDMHLVIRLQNCAKAQISATHANKVTLSYVKMMAETILYVQRNGFNNMEELQKALKKTNKLVETKNEELYAEKRRQKDLNEQIRYMGQYLTTKSVYSEYLQCNNKQEFMEINHDSLEKYAEAKDYLRERYQNEIPPSLVVLKKQRKRSNDNLESLEIGQKKIKEEKKELEAAILNIKKLLAEKEYHLSGAEGKTEKVVLGGR